MSDPASFRPADTIAVFGSYPQCLFTLAWQDVERHHALGRGEEFGIKPDHPDRKLFSSPYNCAPLLSSIHHGPLRDREYVRAALLDAAYRKVNEAIRDGRYQQTDIDRKFLELESRWRTQNGL